MKTNIHPTFNLATVTCACGNTFQVRTTVGDIKVEICAACHPFYTGKQKLVDTSVRVEKYRRRFEKSQSMAKEESTRKATADKAAPVASTEATVE